MNFVGQLEPKIFHLVVLNFETLISRADGRKGYARGNKSV